MCLIDWGLTADVLGALAGLIAAGVAFWAAAGAYPDWLKRQNHLRKSERAEQVLASFYVFKRALAAARDPLLRESDITAADKKLKHDGVVTKGIADPRVVGQAYLDRLHFYSDDFKELHGQIPFAEVNFGSDVAKALGEMLSIHSLLSSEAKFLHQAGTEVFYKYVSSINQLPCQLSTPVRFQVQGDTFLVAPEAAVPKRRAVSQQTPTANRVSAGRLHLDHFRAEISQYGSGKRARQQLSHFDYPQAL